MQLHIYLLYYILYTCATFTFVDILISIKITRVRFQNLNFKFVRLKFINFSYKREILMINHYIYIFVNNIFYII